MIRHKFLGFLLLGFFFTLHPVGAQLLPLGPETAVASSAEIFLGCPRVVGREDRSFVVVWRAGSAIMAQRFDTAGAPAGGPIDVDQRQLEGRTLADLFIENRPGQEEVVVWSSITANDPATRRFHRRILSEPAPVAIPVPSYVRRVFPRRIGGYLAAWSTKRGAGWAIAPLDEAGRLAGPAIRATTTAADPSSFDSIQAADGSLTVYWYTTSTGRLFLRRFNRKLQPVGLSQTVQDTDPSPGGTQIARAPDGRNSVVAWVNYASLPSGLTGDIHIRFFAADSTPLSDPLEVATPADPPVNAFHPEAVGLDRFGRALLVWSLLKFETGTETHSVQLWTPGGSVGIPQDLATGPVISSHLCANAAAAGRTFAVVWQGQLETGEPAIFVRRFFAPG